MRTFKDGTDRARIYCVALFAILLGYYGGLYLLLVFRPLLYAVWMKFIGIQLTPYPFFDFSVVLSWIDCHHAGIDVLRSNPCDPFNRLLGYSPILLDLPIYGIGTDRAAALAVPMDLLFLIALVFVLRPRSPRAFVLALGAGLSPAVAFALERANLDVFDFVVIAAATLYAARGPLQRLLSYAVYFLIGLLKFYPLVLLGLMVRERPRIMFAGGAIAAVILALFVIHYWQPLSMVLAILPRRTYFGDMFGGILLPSGVARLLGLSPGIGLAIYLALLIVSTLIAVTLALRLKADAAVDWQQPNFLLLAAGAFLIVGCFIAGTNVGYRAVMLLFVFPGLIELAARLRDRRARLMVYWILGAALCCLWRQFVERGLINFHLIDIDSLYGLLYFLLRETLWWFLASTLAGFVALYVMQSPFWRLLPIGRGRSA